MPGFIVMRISEVIADERGLYVAANFHEDTVRALADLQQQIAVPNPIDPDKFHCTIVYSRVTIPWDAKADLSHVARPSGWEVFNTRDGKRVLVLLLDSEFLHERFEEAMGMGATYDFPDYKPHITFSYDIGDQEIGDLPVPDIEILISHEVADAMDPTRFSSK